jgi:hypothetical protein
MKYLTFDSLKYHVELYYKMSMVGEFFSPCTPSLYARGHFFPLLFPLKECQGGEQAVLLCSSGELMFVCNK